MIHEARRWRRNREGAIDGIAVSDVMPMRRLFCVNQTIASSTVLLEILQEHYVLRRPLSVCAGQETQMIFGPAERQPQRIERCLGKALTLDCSKIRKLLDSPQRFNRQATLEGEIEFALHADNRQILGAPVVEFMHRDSLLSAAK
jgi:hypothetical protein